MKLSKVLHVANVVVGLAGIVSALVGVAAGTALVWGLTREHLLLCSAVLMLVAIWLAVNTIHHVMLEDRGKVI